jgi:hypothetical protein
MLKYKDLAESDLYKIKKYLMFANEERDAKDTPFPTVSSMVWFVILATETISHKLRTIAPNPNEPCLTAGNDQPLIYVH